jgi:hypothetical protein
MMTKIQYVLFEKHEKWWQSIISDLFTYALAFLLMISSWFLDELAWTLASIFIFIISLTLASCESKALKITSKAEAIKWANNLQDDK